MKGGAVLHTTILPAISKEDIEDVRILFREYEQAIGVDLRFQGFGEELTRLPGRYSPPAGALLLARRGAEAVGCAGLRRLDDTTGEMKRLYVRPQFQGRGLGRKLALRIISLASETGYQRICLDTLANMKEAISLYRSLGFTKTLPYYHNPLEKVLYLSLDL